MQHCYHRQGDQEGKRIHKKILTAEDQRQQNKKCSAEIADNFLAATFAQRVSRSFMESFSCIFQKQRFKHEMKQITRTVGNRVRVNLYSFFVVTFAHNAKVSLSFNSPELFQFYKHEKCAVCFKFPL